MKAFYWVFQGVSRDPITCEQGLLVVVSGKVCAYGHARACVL